MIKGLIQKSLKKLFFREALKKSNYNQDYEGYIQIENPINGKNISMYLRKDSYMEREFINHGLFGNWEKESLKIWATLCQKAEWILDIGANSGVYSLIAQSQNSKAKIFAVEPIDTNFEILVRNIKSNRYCITAEKFAMSEIVGSAKMHMLKDRINYMTSVNDNRYESHPEIKGDDEVVEIEVPIATFAYLEKKYDIPKIDLIKIDVEGHELAVINGMKYLIERDKPIILLEIIGDKNAFTLDKYFKELGYRFVSITEVNKSIVVDKLWDNDHHNFLVCHDKTIQNLRKKKLIECG